MLPSSPTTLFPFPVDRRRHVLVVGKTGAGKSSLLRALAQQDLLAGRGLLLIDPHGDLAADVLADLPRFRRNDLMRFAPREADCPGLNPFRLPAGASHSLAVAALVSIFERLFRESWGFRTEHILRFTCLALMGQRNVNLLDARAMLLDERRRTSILKRVTDPLVLDFWLREFTSYPKPFLAEVLSAPLNKLGALLGAPVIRDVVTRSRPKLDMSVCLERRRVVLADLSKGVIGEDGCRFLGGLLMGALEQAALARASMPAHARQPFFVLVDEAGTFATASLRAMLAESRKFGVGISLAVQSLSALPADTRSAFLGNAGTLVVFRTSGEDAELLSPELGLELGPKTLTAMPVGTAVVRTGGERPILVDFRRPDTQA